MPYGRRASLRVKFEGKNVSGNIGYYLKSASYEDPADGDSDTLSLGLHNIGMRWLKAWAPVQGDIVEAGVLFRGFGGKGKAAVNFGTFTLDSVKYRGGPISLTIGAVSQPATTGFASTKQSFAWKNTQLQEVAQKIADKYKMKLIYEAGDIPIASAEQDKEADSAFLKDLCDKYSMKLKIFNDKIVIYDPAVYEAKGAVATLTRSSFIGDNWSYDSELAGMYQACEISYTNAKTNQDIKVRVGEAPCYDVTQTKKKSKKKSSKKSSSAASKVDTASKYDTSGTPAMDTVRCLYINQSCDGEADAKKKALAALNEANRKITTLSGDIPVNPKIFSTSVVNVKGMGIIDGRYFVKKMTLKIDPSSGSTQSLEMYKIPDLVVDKPADKPGASTHKVGDIVNFKGGTHYVTSYKGAKGYRAKAGPAKITSSNSNGAHPWHLIHTDGTSNVYGWVDEGTF